MRLRTQRFTRPHLFSMWLVVNPFELTISPAEWFTTSCQRSASLRPSSFLSCFTAAMVAFHPSVTKIVLRGIFKSLKEVALLILYIVTQDVCSCSYSCSCNFVTLYIYIYAVKRAFSKTLFLRTPETSMKPL